MIHPKMKYTYIGIDSHKDTHTAVAMDCFYDRLGEVTFNNAPSEFEKFLEDVTKFKLDGTTLLFGLEDISAFGRHLAVFLLRKNMQVKHVNAGLVALERKNFAGSDKTDSIDAQCAARVLLNRFDKLPNADVQDKYWMLRGLVIRRRNIVKTNINLKNHLHSYLTGHYASYGDFFSGVDKLTALAFYEKYPSPETLKDVSVEELNDFLLDITPYGQCKGKAQKILALVKKDGSTTADYQEIRNLAIKSIIRQIRFNLNEIDGITAIIADFLKHFDYKLESMRGIETVTASNLITEIGDISMFPTPAKLARYAGVAPISHSSGKTDAHHASQRGNRTLNAILYKLSIALIRTIPHTNKLVNSIFHYYYLKKLSEGKTKRQSLKCVQRRLITIIWNMMTYKNEYINPPIEALKEPLPEDLLDPELEKANKNSNKKVKNSGKNATI